MRITSEGPGATLGAACIPVPSRLGQAFQSWGYVNGNPGTSPIPAPYPASVPQGILAGPGLGSTDPTNTSKDAPPLWKPGVYYQPKLASRFHGAIDSDNQMPVPARLPNGKYGFQASGNERAFFAARRSQSLRQHQVGWPITTPSFGWRA